MKTITCCVCSGQVSKRSTISVGDNRRCCRGHDEATSFLQNQAILEAQKKGDDNFTVLMAVEVIRCLLTLRRAPEFILLSNIERSFRASGKMHLMPRVRKEVQEKGVLSSSELAAAISLAASMGIHKEFLTE